MATLNKFNFDVAFSLKHEDLPFAQSVFDALGNYNLSTFFYPHNQTDLANKNGISVFVDTFKKNSRVVVLFYREGYGETYWTRIEHTAIQERYLKEGADFCVLVRLDKSKPVWYPEFMQYTSSTMEPEQIAELILKKIEDMGGELKEKTLEEFLEHARIVRESKALHYQKLLTASSHVFDVELTKIQTEMHNLFKTLLQNTNELGIESRLANLNEMQVNISKMGLRIQKLPLNVRFNKGDALSHSLRISLLSASNGNTHVLKHEDFKINLLNETEFGWSLIRHLPEEVSIYTFRVWDYVTKSNFELDSKVFTSEELVRKQLTDFVKWVYAEHRG